MSSIKKGTAKISIKPIVPSNEKKLSPHVDLPETCFRWIVVGTSGSGKSVLLENLMRKDLYGQVFKQENIVILSPTLKVHDPFPFLKDSIKISEYDDFVPTIQKLLAHISALSDEHGPDKIPPTLLIIDDCSAHPTMFKTNGAVDRLYLTGRNYNISILCIAHRLNLLSRNVKLNINAACLFPTVDHSELESFMEKFVDKTKRKIIEHRIAEVFNKKHNFIFIDFTRQRDEQLREGFHEVLMTEKDEARIEAKLAAKKKRKLTGVLDKKARAELSDGSQSDSDAQ